MGKKEEKGKSAIANIRIESASLDKKVELASIDKKEIDKTPAASEHGDEDEE